MLEKIREITNSKLFHIVILMIIVTVILAIGGITILNYAVEGETNMPFKLTKISIISSEEGKDKEATDAKWAFDVYQPNDIYLYIEKNHNYKKTEAIKSINIDNIEIESKNKDNINIYKPDSESQNSIFKNSDENKADTIQYTGAMASSFKDMQISNQGGIIVFRCSNDNIAEYKSDKEEVNHTELLKELEIKNEDLIINLKFNLTINLENGNAYKTTISLDLPKGDVVNNGTTSTEITDVKDFVFKRV